MARTVKNCGVPTGFCALSGESVSLVMTGVGLGVGDGDSVGVPVGPVDVGPVRVGVGVGASVTTNVTPSSSGIVMPVTGSFAVMTAVPGDFASVLLLLSG